MITLLFRLTAKIYPSTFLLLYMSTAVPVHHYTCPVYLFLFGIPSTITFQFIYWDTYTQIYPKIRLPVYLHASLLSNHKTYLSPQLLVYMPIDVPVHYPNCSFCLFHSDKPFALTCPLTCCSKYSQIYLFINQPVQFVGVFHLVLHTHLAFKSSAALRTDRPTRK